MRAHYCNKDLLTYPKVFFHFINFPAGYCEKGSGGRAVPKDYEEPIANNLPSIKNIYQSQAGLLNTKQAEKTQGRHPQPCSC
jgi:hypothetical protein